MTYNTFTLTGTFKKPNGTADKGGVVVIPSVTPLVDTSGKIILAGAVTAQLDSNGAFTLVLPTTGADLLPASFGYTLLYSTDGHGSGTTSVTFTPTGNGTTLNVSDIVPAPLPAVVTPTAVTQAGLDGAVQSLVNDAASASRIALTTQLGTYVSAATYGLSTSGTGAANATAIAAALAALPAAGGTVFIPKGTYTITGDITISNDNVALRGVADATFLDIAGGGIVVNGFSGFTTEIGLHDLSIKRSGTAGPALRLKGGGNGTGVAHFNASNVRVRSSTGEGLLIDGSYIATFTGCYFMSCSTYGIKTALDSGSGTVSANDVTFIGGETQGCANGIYLDTVRSITFIGHAIEGNTTTGVEIPRDSYGVAFLNCHFEGNVGYDLKVGTTTTCTGVLVFGGYVQDGVGAKNNSIILVRGRAMEFRGITFYGTTNEPISVQEAVPGAVWGNVANCVAEGLRTGIVNYGTATEFNKDYVGRSTVNPVSAHYSGSAVLDFGSIAAGAQASLTITVTGVVTTDDATAHPGTGLEAGLVYNAFVSATDTVTVRVSNISAAPVDPAARTWHTHVWRI